MIDSTLLDRLQKADPETWKRFDEAEIAEDVYAWDLSDEAREAWLQAVLQDAIRVRGWHQEISGIECDGYRWIAYINFPARIDFVDSDWMDSPAEALLKCYLAAIEAQPCR